MQTTWPQTRPPKFISAVTDVQRVEFDQDFHYCTGEVCHTPKELFDLLADDYRTYVEIELTKGKRELTEDDVKEADTLCKRYLDRWKEELG